MRRSRTLPDETVDRAVRAAGELATGELPVGDQPAADSGGRTVDRRPRGGKPSPGTRTPDRQPPDADAPGTRPPSVALLLFSAYRSMESRIFGALTRAGFDDVTPAQGRLFRGVRPGGSRMTELAEAAHVTKQTVGFLVEQLERAGYVTRVPDPADARARLVKIAPKGAAAISIGAAVVAEAEAEWAALIGPERMAGLRDTLQMLWDMSEPVP
jgi:DNA-binding MarR family transcriptional regulator